jgi:hypothetical protein
MLDQSNGVLGWATADLVHLDTLEPGVIARLLTAAPRVRHAMLLAVAAQGTGREGGAADTSALDTALAQVLRRERARDIVVHVFGESPDGLIGALARLGDAPLTCPLAYLGLRDIFTSSSNAAKAKVLGQVGDITEQKLAVIDALDPRWLHPEALARIGTPSVARAFNAAIAAAQQVSSTATDEMVMQMIGRLQHRQSLADVVERLKRRADRLPAHPITEDTDIRPVTTAPDMIRTGRAYRNCLVQKIDDVLAGRTAYAEFRGEAILEFRPLAGGYGWLFAEAHVANNAMVSPTIYEAARRKCLDLGIPFLDLREDAMADRRIKRLLASTLP